MSDLAFLKIVLISSFSTPKSFKKMSFVKDVNPLNGILCCPYYFLWIAIIFTWLLSWIELLLVCLIHAYRRRILRIKGSLDVVIQQKFNQTLIKIRQELHTIHIEDAELPLEVVEIIVSMLPNKDEAKSKIIKESC